MLAPDFPRQPGNGILRIPLEQLERGLGAGPEVVLQVHSPASVRPEAEAGQAEPPYGYVGAAHEWRARQLRSRPEERAEAGPRSTGDREAVRGLECAGAAWDGGA